MDRTAASLVVIAAILAADKAATWAVDKTLILEVPRLENKPAPIEFNCNWSKL